MELTLQPEQMASDPVHVGVGGSVLAGLVWLAKKLWTAAKDSKEAPDDEVPTVRDWKNGQSRIEALLRGIEAQLTEANLPELRRHLDHARSKINSVEATQMRQESDMEDFRREVRGEMDGMRRQIRDMNDRIGKCEE